MSEAWRNGYDAWKLAGPPEDDFESDEDREAWEEARDRAEDLAVSRYVEERQEAKHVR